MMDGPRNIKLKENVSTGCKTHLILTFVEEERLIISPTISSSAHTDFYSDGYRLIFP